MRAMILAAGEGRRMRPLTNHTPKPLLSVKGKPLIVWHIEKLAKSGFKSIVINIAHLGDQIPATLGDGRKWNIDIIYSDEQKSGALESAGGIIKALQYLGEQFIVVNGDVWSDYQFNSHFELKDKLAHLILVPNPEHNLEGDFLYQDKKYTFSGMGYYSADIFKDCKEERQPLAPILKNLIDQKMVSFELYQGIWHDIGTPQRLEAINRG
jgi:MurNAc alpha-1-phosphate uridylyltransferase